MKAVGIDIGTTSISAVVIDALTGHTERTWTISNPGFIDSKHAWERIQDADKIISAARNLLDEILVSFSDISVIGLTGQMHGIVYLDQDGNRISPLITWQDERGNLPDEDGVSLCRFIADRFRVKAYSGYGLISHLQNIRMNTVPDQAVAVASIADYLGMVLTGLKQPILHSSMAASFGLYDIRTHEWRLDILRAFGADGTILPKVSQKFELIGSYRGIPVSIAVGDNQASFLGSVQSASDEILINMGTGGQISMLTDHIIEAEDVETRPFNENLYLSVGASLCGGRAYAMLAGFMKSCAEAFHGDSSDVYTVMENMLSTSECLNPIRIDTRFAGTREHPEHRGSIENITTDNFTPDELVRATLSGMVQELKNLYDAMNSDVGIHHKRIIASGNGMRKNKPLQRIAAEAFGMELELSKQTEEAACGAAIAGLDAIQFRSWKETIGYGNTN